MLSGKQACLVHKETLLVRKQTGMKKCYDVRILEMDQTFPCQENESVMDGIKRWGKGPINHGCFGGGCGVCKCKVISGDYYITKNMSRAHVTEEEKEKNIVLMCCIKPCGNLVITRRYTNLYPVI